MQDISDLSRDCCSVSNELINNCKRGIYARSETRRAHSRPTSMRPVTGVIGLSVHVVCRAGSHGIKGMRTAFSTDRVTNTYGDAGGRLVGYRAVGDYAGRGRGHHY